MERVGNTGDSADVHAIGRSLLAARRAALSKAPFANGATRTGLRLVGVPAEPACNDESTPDTRRTPRAQTTTFEADRSIAAPRRRATTDRDIARENLEAAHNRSLDPRDPRWRVALETAKLLEGPLMTFERRRRVLAFAQSVGVRPFDTHLIIAAMQDRARRGEPLDSAMPVIAMTGPARGAGSSAIEAELDARAERDRVNAARPWPVRLLKAFWPYGLAAAIAFAAHALLGWWLLG
ncbi:MAG: hypothetical protein JNM94_12435 [Phycisphaerae bacterium]|nr:hypothetical protein [Phycisphaerae bacterium]